MNDFVEKVKIFSIFPPADIIEDYNRSFSHFFGTCLPVIYKQSACDFNLFSFDTKVMQTWRVI
jgi:hypothetical protein